MYYKEIIVILTSIINIIGAIIYIKGMINGKNKPNRITWGIWAIAPLIGTAIAFSHGVALSIIPVFMAGFSPLLIFISSFLTKNGYWKLEKFDYLCGLFAILSLLLWLIVNQPIFAIIFAIATDLLAGIPTFRKIWSFPETEGSTPFMAGLIANLSSFLVMKTFLPIEYLFQSYLVLFNITAILLIYRKKF